MFVHTGAGGDATNYGGKGGQLQQGALRPGGLMPRFSAAGGGSLLGPQQRKLSHTGSGRFSINDFAGGQGVRHAPIRLDGQTGAHVCRLAVCMSALTNKDIHTRTHSCYTHEQAGWPPSAVRWEMR